MWDIRKTRKFSVRPRSFNPGKKKKKRKRRRKNIADE